MINLFSVVQFQIFESDDGTLYNIDKAKEVSSKYGTNIVIHPYDIPMAAFRHIDMSSFDINKSKISEPGIAVTNRDGSLLLIDGWHRALTAKIKNERFGVIVIPSEYVYLCVTTTEMLVKDYSGGILLNV